MDAAVRKLLPALVAALTVAGCATMRVESDYDREASFVSAGTWAWTEAEVDRAEEIEGAAEAEEEEEIERIDPFLLRRLRRAVATELDARGFREAPGPPADLLVDVVVTDVDELRSQGRYAPSLLLGIGFAFGFGHPLAYSYGAPWAYWPYYSPYYWSYYSPYYGRRYRAYGARAFGFGLSPRFGYAYPYGRYGYRSYGGYPAREVGLAPGSFVIEISDGESGELIWRGWADGALGYAPEGDDMLRFIETTVRRILEDFPPESRR